MKMKIVDCMIAFILMGVLFGTGTLNVQAANEPRGSIYTATEEDLPEVTDFSGLELKDGDKIKMGDYVIEVSEKIVCTESLSRSETKSWQSITTYGVYQGSVAWYKITQTTNYTYDGTTAHINTGAGKSTVLVEKLQSDCAYSINKNSVNNTNSKAPTYTIEVSMKFPNRWLTITDVATVYPDGNTSLKHNEN